MIVKLDERYTINYIYPYVKVNINKKINYSRYFKKNIYSNSNSNILEDKKFAYFAWYDKVVNTNYLSFGILLFNSDDLDNFSTLNNTKLTLSIYDSKNLKRSDYIWFDKKYKPRILARI